MLKVCTSDTKNQRLFVEVQVSESEALVWQKREKPAEIEYRKPDMTPEKSVSSNHTSPIQSPLRQRPGSEVDSSLRAPDTADKAKIAD